jgi:hypothetical protein
MAKKPLKNGLYYAYAPDYKPQMVDPNYNGFRIVYLKESTAPCMHAAGPQVISDSLPGVKSMADGKIYDSKSQLYESYKRHDVHIVEKGEHDLSKGGYKDRLTKADLSCRKELKAAIQQHLGS